MPAKRFRQSLRLAAALLAVTFLPGCVTKYVFVNEVARSEVRLVIASTDGYRAGRLLAELEEHGFDNEENEVIRKARDGFGIRWGAAPVAYVEEIVRAVEDRFDVRLDRSQDLGSKDYEVVVNLPFADVRLPDRSEFEVVIFTDAEARGDELLAQLLALGYTNEENYVTTDPNDYFNIKWGMAPDEFADEVIAAVAMLDSSIEVEPEHVFEFDDNDIFINLPFWRLEPPERKHFEVSVFCDDEDLGDEVLAALAELGYTNEDNEVLESPNDEFNVKYGGLPQEFLDEIVGWLEDRFGQEFDRQDIWDENDNDVFINIPDR